MITFTGIDASGRKREGIMWTKTNIVGWVRYLRHINWQQLTVRVDGVAVAGITYNRHGGLQERRPHVWRAR